MSQKIVEPVCFGSGQPNHSEGFYCDQCEVRGLCANVCVNFIRKIDYQNDLKGLLKVLRGEKSE